MSKKEFMNVCLDNFSKYMHIGYDNALELFNEYDIFSYINEFYDVLNGSDYSYINKDIEIYISSKRQGMGLIYRDKNKIEKNKSR
ncbi:MAG: DUF3791 domain-containing protein [Clostridia bacterium]|nr:DUF3791 domain-containing protein [Clostridia bacterium]